MQAFLSLSAQWPPILPKVSADSNHNRRIIDSLEGLCYPPPHASGAARPILLVCLLDPFMKRSFIFPSWGQAGTRSSGLILWLLGFCLTVLGPVEGMAKPKPSRGPRPEPELKIVDLNIAPVPYSPSTGALEFSVTVQLPKELNGSTLLEVSSLISSPSKTSLRFLAIRQPVAPPVESSDGTPPTLSVLLAWDGKDHRKQVAGAGTYSYEVRSKLLAIGDKGPRTMLVSWPKRGTLEVK
jgi:hypothetical protein